MTREFSTKPRFEDNGDIEPCDTETRMMIRPDDLGENGASSVEKGAVLPRGDDAVISVPLLQSPISSRAQGSPGDGAARICSSIRSNNIEDNAKSSFDLGEKITEENTKFQAFSYAGQSNGQIPLTTQSMANQMLNPGVQNLEFQLSRRFNQEKTLAVSDVDLKICQSEAVNTSQTSQNDGKEGNLENIVNVDNDNVDKIDAFDKLRMINSLDNLDQNSFSGLALKSDSDVRSAIRGSNLVEIKKSAVSLLKKGNHDCHVDEQQTDGIRQNLESTTPFTGLAGLKPVVGRPGLLRPHGVAGLGDRPHAADLDDSEADVPVVQGLNPLPLQLQSAVSDLNRKETDTATATSSSQETGWRPR